MRIPLYFDSYNDEYKFNGLDKKFNDLLYDIGEKFLDTFPNLLKTNFIKTEQFHKKYFYPINLSCNFFHYADHYNFDIPNNIINDVKNEKCKLLIINILEGYELSRFEDLLKDKLMKKYNLKYSNFILITGNLIKISKKGIKNIYYNHWESIIIFHDEIIYDTVLENIFSNKIRDHKFICLQRRPKAQRLMLYTELYDHRNDGILTMGIGDNAVNLDLIRQIENNEIFNYKTLRKYQKKNLISTLPKEYDVKLAIDNPTHDSNIEKYLNSYLHIVSETNFEYVEDQMFFSEKIYKPMVFLQPFILFSQPHSLKYLRELGFRTFHSKYINEDYDNIKNDRERFLAALTQTQRVLSMPKNQLNDMTKEFLDILVHNYDNLKFRYNNNKDYYYELLKFLY